MPETVEDIIAQMTAFERAGMARLLCPVGESPVKGAEKAFIRAATRACNRTPEGQEFERDPEYRFFLAQLKWTRRMEARR